MPETEAKFRIPDDSALQALLRLESVAAFHVTGRRTVDQSDLYYDTPSRQAAQQDASIRVRTLGAERLFTVKSGAIRDGVSRREEIEEPADAGNVIEWLAALVESGRIRIAFSPGELEPVLEIRNRREILDLEGPDDTCIELAIDRVRFSGPRGERDDLELELELRSGSEDRLREACDHLRADFNLQPSTEGKYRRALALVG